MGDQEVEVKFLLRDLPALRWQLEAEGALLEAERSFEMNLRFDFPDSSLRARKHVLRLRQDARAVMTFKGASASDSGASARQEIEFAVSDFDSARRLLEALGFRVVVSYEKYRTTYLWKGLHITLDEMPYGHFAEIESAGTEDIEMAVQQIRDAAQALGLDWETRSQASYLGMFEELRARRNLAVRNLTFAEFETIHVTAEDFGLRFAD